MTSDAPLRYAGSMRAAAPLLWILLAACSSGRYDFGDGGGTTGQGGDTSSGVGASTGTDTGSGAGPTEPPIPPAPAGTNGLCMAYNSDSLPDVLGTWSTTCTPEDPYHCTDTARCSSEAFPSAAQGFAFTACLGPRALHDDGAWPPAGARVGLFARAGEIAEGAAVHAGFGVELGSGEVGFYQAKGASSPAWIIAQGFQDSPLTKPVSICFDGALSAWFWYGPGLRFQLGSPIPAGTTALHAGVEVEAPNGVEALGYVQILDVQTFPLGSMSCDDLWVEQAACP